MEVRLITNGSGSGGKSKCNAGAAVKFMRTVCIGSQKGNSCSKASITRTSGL